MNNAITLTVTREEAQLLLNALAEQPYRQVATLVPKILTQANASAPTEGILTNGHDHSDDAHAAETA